MLSIKVLKAGSASYFTSLSRYYFRPRKPGPGGPGFDDDDSDPFYPGWDGGFNPLDLIGEGAGTWQGRGAWRLGLMGTIEKPDYERVMAGLHPETKRPLVLNADSPNRTQGFDLAFSPPKSFDVLWTLASDEERRQLDDA
ncbi:MAG: relaxase domain-containing protein, partial [Nocardioidaceae bacterium]|nr:relaxase domain-containing protein [Nocardioidaceae bacterium]